MKGTKIVFGEDGQDLIYDDYEFDENEISNDDENEDDPEEVDESTMSLEEIKAWSQAEAQGMSYADFLNSNKTPQKPRRDKIDIANVLDPNIRAGKQSVRLSAKNKAAIKRTYIIELENLQKLEEIKVLYYKNQFIQYSEVVNDAIEHYYKCLMKN